VPHGGKTQVVGREHRLHVHVKLCTPEWEIGDQTHIPCPPCNADVVCAGTVHVQQDMDGPSRMRVHVVGDPVQHVHEQSFYMICYVNVLLL
jgi:hypothetical protein